MPEFTFECTGAVRIWPPPPRRSRCSCTSPRPPASPCMRWRCVRRSASSRCGADTTTPRPTRCAICSASGRGGAARSSRCSSASSTRWCRPSPGETDVDVALPCSYDFDVAANKYLYALEDGEVPLLLLFSGTVFTAEGNGFSVSLVPWDREAQFRLPVAVWKQTMQLHFPGTAWLRLGERSFDALHRYRTEQQLTSWDDADRAAAQGGRRSERAASMASANSPTRCCSRATCSTPTARTIRRTACAGSSVCSHRPASSTLDTSERSFLQTDCLLEGARRRGHRRRCGSCTFSSASSSAPTATASTTPTSLDVGDATFLPWDEAVVHESASSHSRCAAWTRRRQRRHPTLGRRAEIEPLRDHRTATSRPAGPRTTRRHGRLSCDGRAAARAPTACGACVCGWRTRRRGQAPDSAAPDRPDALRHALVAAHLVLSVRAAARSSR